MSEPRRPLAVFIKDENGVYVDTSLAACPVCQTVFSVPAEALLCCPGCDCGAMAPSGFRKCHNCYYRELFEKAEEVPYTGTPLFSPENGTHYDSMEELLDSLLDDDLPAYVFPCKELLIRDADPVELAYLIEEKLLEEQHEEAEASDIELLGGSIASWLEKQKDGSWQEDTSKKVRVARPRLEASGST